MVLLFFFFWFWSSSGPEEARTADVDIVQAVTVDGRQTVDITEIFHVFHLGASEQLRRIQIQNSQERSSVDTSRTMMRVLEFWTKD